METPSGLKGQGAPTIATATGEAFLNNPVLHQEVFGPYSLIIRCKDMTEMLNVVKNLEGQLTATLMATDNDINYHEELTEAIKNICGRFILNSVPTGCGSLHEYAAWRPFSGHHGCKIHFSWCRWHQTFCKTDRFSKLE